MNVEEPITAAATIDVENVGGIDSASVSFSPGVSILVGRNASNRTSLLHGVMASLGSDDVSIKGDAAQASVELALQDGTYSATLERVDGDVHTTGEPYLDDPTVADLFAFLLESNEARRAVARNDDLRELLMRPVDTDAIQREIETLTERRRAIEEELASLDDLKGRLPELAEERTRLEAQIDGKRDELAAVEAELESTDEDVADRRAEKDELEAALAELRDKRSSLDDVRYDIETEEESLDALVRERRELEDELAGLVEAPVGEIEETETEIDRLRRRKQTLEADVSELQSVIQFNEEMLEDADADVFASLDDGGTTSDAAVTEQLLEGADVTCWTCGSEVEADQIEVTVDRLRTLSRERMAEIGEIQEDLDDLVDRRSTLQEQQRRRERVERSLRQLADDVDETEATIEQLRERRAALTTEIEDVEATVDDLDDASRGEVLDLHREANQLEYEIGRLESDLDRVTDDVASIEDQLAEEDTLEAEVADVQAEIEDRRTRIERIETQAIEEFNAHMDTVLEVLGYANLERIWLERVRREVREGRRTVEKSAFELHVVRSTASGATYEDTVDHLSESEREVTGLVFALAGYLAHELYETVPFMLLDSLEAIDSERIATLVEYFTEYTGYLLVALLPEDAAALPDEYDRIAEI